MIKVTRLHGETLIVNASLLEFIEATPDTLLSMATGRKVMVRESVDAVIALVRAYQQSIGSPDLLPFNPEREALGEGDAVQG